MAEIVLKLDDALSEALSQEAKRRGLEPSEVVLQILRDELGLGGTRSNGLRNLSGTWSSEQLKGFEEVTATLDIDPELLD